MRLTLRSLPLPVVLLLLLYRLLSLQFLTFRVPLRLRLALRSCPLLPLFPRLLALRRQSQRGLDQALPPAICPTGAGWHLLDAIRLCVVVAVARLRLMLGDLGLASGALQCIILNARRQFPASSLLAYRAMSPSLMTPSPLGPAPNRVTMTRQWQ